jgi:hypothetical protein
VGKSKNMQNKTLENCNKCKVGYIYDVEKLCKSCPVLKDIESNIENAIKKFVLFKSIQRRETLKEYLKKKINEGTKLLEDIINWEKDGQVEFTLNRNALLLSWKSVIKYYSDQLEPTEKENANTDTENIALNNVKIFIDDFIEGIKYLQQNDSNEQCIMNIRENKPDKETSFRYSFKKFFDARCKHAIIIPEPEKGKTRIDLKIIHKELGEKIIEFKGWWNHKKEDVASQICGYLTDFEKDGYIFMINDLKQKDITKEYKEIILSEKSNYIQESWIVHNYKNTDFKYFESKHKFSTKEKIIYHFIFNVYF